MILISQSLGNGDETIPFRLTPEFLAIAKACQWYTPGKYDEREKIAKSPNATELSQSSIFAPGNRIIAPLENEKCVSRV